MPAYFWCMKATTLARVQIKSRFWFGNVEFIKLEDSKPDLPEQFLYCQIGGQQAFVLISDAAWVEYEE